MTTITGRGIGKVHDDVDVAVAIDRVE